MLFFPQVIPYVGLIAGGLKPDMAVFFQGMVPAYAKRYHQITAQ